MNADAHFPEPLAAPDFARSTVRQGQIGDFLLVFGDETPPRRGRTEGPWTCLERFDSAFLWAQEKQPGWAGMPWRCLETAAGKAWLFGELFGDSLKKLPAIVADRASAAELNGHFLLLVQSAETRDWRLYTSRLGTLHAYVARRSQRVAVGSSFAAVANAASGRRLDWQALAGFFACGFFPGDLTPFDDISILRSARRYVFSEFGELRAAKRYWAWQHQPEVREDREVADELGDLLSTVTADLCADGGVALPISGGLDSRTVVGALPPSADVWAYSYGWGRRSIENRIARRIAERRHLPYQSFVIGPYLMAELESITAATEGFQDLTLCRQAAIHEALASQAQSVLGAHWGDVWNDQMGQLDAPADQDLLEVALKKMVRPGGALLADLVCRGPLGDDPSHSLRAVFARELKALGHLEDPDFRLKAFKTDQWSARFTTASLRVFQAAAFPRLPYYDNRIVDFYCRLPSSQVAGRRLQIQLLRRRAPDLAAIEWQAAGTDLFHCHWPPRVLQLWRGLRKVGRVLTFERVIERNWQVQFQGAAGRAGLERHLLRPGLRLHDLLPPTPTRELLQRFYRKPDPALAYQVAMLLSFSVFLERA